MGPYCWQIRIHPGPPAPEETNHVFTRLCGEPRITVKATGRFMTHHPLNCSGGVMSALPSG